MHMQWRQRVLPDMPWLLIVVGLTIALRVVWIVRAETFPVPGMDPLFYDQTARRLADGLGFTNLDGTPTALFPPGYPYALAIIYKVFGASLAVGQAYNVGVSVVVVLATYTLGRLAFGRAAALLGALLWAVFPSQVIWSSLLMPELIFTLAFILSLVLVFVSNRVGSTGGQMAAVAGAGVLAGAASLIRGQALGLWLVLALWVLLRRRPGELRKVAVYIGAMLLVLVPWTVRNARELDAPVLVSTNIGWNAVIGHSDRADGGFWSPAAFGVFDEYLLIPNPAGEVERNEAGIRMAFDWARGHLRKEGELAVRKTVILWRDDADAVLWQELGRVPAFMGSGERRWLTNLSNVFYYGVLVLGGAGLLSAFRRSEPWASLVVLVVLYWTAVHIIFFSENRFHYPLSPLMSLAAATGLLRLAGMTVARYQARLTLTPPASARPPPSGPAP